MSNELIIKIEANQTNGMMVSELNLDGLRITIDWGDSTVNNHYGGIRHIYDEEGEYTITITGVSGIQDGLLKNIENVIEVIIPNNITTLPDEVFIGCSNLEKVVLPNGISSIGNMFCYDCPNLVELNLPNGLEDIGIYFLIGCGLDEVIFPYGVSVISNGALQDSNVSNVVIPKSVTSIGNNVFQGCANLSYIEIPNSVDSIGDNFLNGSPLTIIKFNSETPPTIGSDFLNGNDNCSIHIPEGNRDAYLNASNYPSDSTRYVEYPTLKYKLETLGKLIASNLTKQFVSASWDEGLTTLANKIQDIELNNMTGFLADIGFYDEDNWNGTAILFRDKGTAENNDTINTNYVKSHAGVNAVVGSDGTTVSSTTYADCFYIANVLLPNNWIAEFTIVSVDSYGGIAFLNSSKELQWHVEYDLYTSPYGLKWYQGRIEEWISNDYTMPSTIKLKKQGTSLEIYLNNTLLATKTINDTNGYLGWKTHSHSSRNVTFKDFKIETSDKLPTTILKDKLIFNGNATFSFNNVSFPNTFTWNFIAHTKYPDDTITCHGELNGSIMSINDKIDYEFLITITRQNGGSYRVICETTGDEWEIIDFSQESLSISTYNPNAPIVITDIYFSEEYEDNSYEKIYYNVVWDLISNNSNLEFPVLLLKNGKPYYEYLITEESCRWDIISGLSIPLYYEDSNKGCWGVSHYKRTDDTNTYSWTTPKQYGLKAYDDDPYSSICYNENSENRVDFHANGKTAGCENFEESNYSKNTQTPYYISEYDINDFVDNNFGLSFEYIADENENDGKIFEVSWNYFFNSTFRFYYDGTAFKLQDPTGTRTLDIPYSNHIYFTLYRLHSYNSWDLIITANDQRNFYEYNMVNNWIETPIHLNTVTFYENCEIRKFYHWNMEEVQP